MSYNFIGFYGAVDIKQKELVHVIGKDFECWDLSKCTLDEFVEKIKIRIPPINNNVLRNYINTDGGEDGISKEQFSNCRWGILLPSITDDGYSPKLIISLVNLYSTAFLKPAFYVSYLGIRVINRKALGNWLHIQDRSNLFKSSKFISFFHATHPVIQYFQWYRNNVISWGDEDWRLYMAASFYEGLEEYEGAKAIYTWQRESADMATLLETLLTAGESEKEEIGYRLRKRIFTLIGWKFPLIEKEIKELYSDRSQFVHGSYYKRIVKEMRKNKDGDNALPPSPDFEKLYKTKEYIRFSFVAYLALHNKKMNGKSKIFDKFQNVQELLEAGILDTNLRKKIIDVVKPVVDLLPESKTGYIWP